MAATLVVSAAALAVALAGVDRDRMMESLRQVAAGGAAAYLGLLVAMQAVRALRWRALVAPLVGVSRTEAWRLCNVGAMLTMLLPLRLGELARPEMMARRQALPRSSTLAVVAVERVLDGLVVTLMFFAAGWWPGAAPPLSQPLLWAAAAALALFVALAALASLGWAARAWLPGALAAWAAAPGRSPTAARLALRLATAAARFAQGLGTTASPSRVARAVAWTAASWGLQVAALWALMAAMGWALSSRAAAVVASLLVLGIMVPAAPGYLGTYQAAVVVGLTAFGVGRDGALAYAVVAYLLNLLVVVGLGVMPWWAWRQRAPGRGGA